MALSLPAKWLGQQIELVLRRFAGDGARSMIVFGGCNMSDVAITKPKATRAHRPNHHLVILALSTAFFDAHLRGDAAAKAWLEDDGPHSVMEKEDALRKK